MDAPPASPTPRVVVSHVQIEVELMVDALGVSWVARRIASLISVDVAVVTWFIVMK